MSYYKDDEFQTRCLGGCKRPKQMKGYIDSIREHILKPIECEVLITGIENIIQSRKRNYLFDGIDIICVLMENLVSLSRAGNNKAQEYIENKFNTSYNSIDAWKGVLKQYKEFLKEFVEKPTLKTNKRYSITAWKKAIKTIESIIVECNASNGLESLLAKFGSQEDFVKAVVENSYFFSSSSAENVHKSLCTKLQNNTRLHARKSADGKVQSNGMFHNINENSQKVLNIPISIDPTGNRYVQDIIFDQTGYTVSCGRRSIFQNFIISHIWGKAYDPRYFTNLWNLAIVPAWGNFLLDKSDSQDELTLKMINTFKAIAIKQYSMNKLNWQSIGLCRKSMRPSRNYVVSGIYSIHIIENKKENRPYGAIKIVKVRVRS